MDESALKELLLKENAEFRKLYEEHQRYEKRLAVLGKKTYLSEDERLEEKELKKKKLSLKDRMYSIMRDFHKAS
jgi:uncharacterized protein YdcH (DUF465 family)